jgi:hypothetical protein
VKLTFVQARVEHGFIEETTATEGFDIASYPFFLSIIMTEE